MKETVPESFQLTELGERNKGDELNMQTHIISFFLICLLLCFPQFCLQQQPYST